MNELEGARHAAGDQSAAYIQVRDLVVWYGKVQAVTGVSFQVRRGELLTLLGPSGCGKTTILRALAGLEHPVSGEILLDGQPMYSHAEGVNVPTEKRDVSMVFQSYALWPNMSVFDNVAYGLRVRRRNRREIEEKVSWALDLVRMREFVDRSATNLSGGQQQRVALARALAFSPRVLLLDEPLSNLDARLRAEMRVEIRELQSALRMTAVYVTHDQEEALAISDRVLVLRTGRIEQEGTPEEIYNRPRSTFIADFVGSANLVRGKVRKDLCRGEDIALETPQGLVVYGTGSADQAGSEGTFAIRTIFPTLSRTKPDVQNNIWPVRIRRKVFLGDFVQYLLDWEGMEFVVRCSPRDLFERDESVYLSVEPRYCVLTEE